MTDGANEPVGKVPTPCVRNCCLDDNDMCLGCFRLLSEILAWGKASEDEKREILIGCRLREKQCHGKERGLPFPK